MRTNKKGFTLIELLVVVSIIGLLASVILASLNNARGKARDARRKSDIHQIQLALNLYFGTNGSYPASSGATQPNSAWFSSADASWNTFQTALLPYISALPKDPQENNIATEWVTTGYHYYYYAGTTWGGCPTGSYYVLTYHLENGAGPITDSYWSACDGVTTYSTGGVSANNPIKIVGERP